MAASAARARRCCLLHGHPQTHAIWHRVAPQLAEQFTVVAVDLRGYGDSGRPAADAEHAAYSKREMALDALAVMRHARLRALPGAGARPRRARGAPARGGPSRGGRAHAAAGHRAHAGDVREHLGGLRARLLALVLPDPAAAVARGADRLRPGALRAQRDGRAPRGPRAFAPEALAEYERCAGIPGTAESICADYRASATIDLVHDRADLAAGRKLAQPLRVLWGEHGAVGRNFDVLALWRACADDVTGRALPCGHYIPEEAPAELLAEALAFFSGANMSRSQ
jgi:haloacetate dehalogenase